MRSSHGYQNLNPDSDDDERGLEEREKTEKTEETAKAIAFCKDLLELFKTGHQLYQVVQKSKEILGTLASGSVQDKKKACQEITQYCGEVQKN